MRPIETGVATGVNTVMRTIGGVVGGQVGAAILTAKAQVVSEEAKIQQAVADVVDAEAAVKVAQAELERAEVLVKFATIVSPFDGVVTQRSVDTKHFVQPATGPRGEALFVVMRTDIMRIRVEVPEIGRTFDEKADQAISR